jgi:hypothetical protein
VDIYFERWRKKINTECLWGHFFQYDK